MLAHEKKKILVVDDDITVRKLVKYHLSKNDYDIYEAVNAAEGYEQLNKNDIDLVLCDVTMEGMDGFTFCKNVRAEQNYKVLPFIFVTARTTYEDKMKAHEVGGDELVTKPFDIKDLLIRVQTLLRRTEIFRVYGSKKNLVDSVAPQTPKILLVDDDNLLTRLFSDSLKKENYECLVANSAEEALTIAKQVIPDIIVSDVMMPEVDGFEFRKRILKNSQLKSVPFIFLSSNSAETNMLTGYDLGITDYILKTSGTKVIVAKVNAILNNLIKERQKVISELNSAVDGMRARVVPDRNPEFGNFIINQWHQPYQGVPGGDFIDYFKLDDDNLAIILGDVMGKKWGAWYFTFAYAGYIRSSVRMVLQNSSEFSPSHILQKVNNSVYQDSNVSEVFATLSVVILNKENFTLKYSGAGDLPLILKEHKSNHVSEITAKGSLLGFKEDGSFEDTVINLSEGDSFFMVTDGVIESRDIHGQAFGSQKIHEILTGAVSNISEFEKVKSELILFTGGRFDDDVSLICIKLS